MSRPVRWIEAKRIQFEMEVIKMGKFMDLLSQRASRESLTMLFLAQRMYASRADPVLLHRAVRSGLEKLLDGLGELPGITADDVFDTWHSLCPELDDDWQVTFDRFFALFCESLDKSMQSRWRSDPIPLSPIGKFETLQYPATETLWESTDKAFRIEIVGCLPAGFRMFCDDQHGNERVFIQLQGCGSDRFFRKFCEQVKSTTSALLDSILRLNAQWLYDQLGAPENRVFPQHINREDNRQFEEGMRLWEVCETIQSAVIEGDESLPSPTLQLLRAAITALFTDVTTRKDSVERRIKNSVRLLVEAKGQTNSAIGLALSVSAIEALLCRKGDNVAQMFSENMAVLLEPDPNYRAAAERWSKVLYDKRSGVLHGSLIDCTPEDFVGAEIAAIAALKAIIERRAGVKRLGGEFDNPESLLKEFRDGKYASGHPMFVNETPINRFWRLKAQRNP